MPITVVPISELKPISRKSKLSQTAEWPEIIAALKKGLPKDSAIRITFTPETVRLFKGDVKKCALAFCMRLRKDYGNKFKIQLADKTEIRILNHEGK